VSDWQARHSWQSFAAGDIISVRARWLNDTLTANTSQVTVTGVHLLTFNPKRSTLNCKAKLPHVLACSFCYFNLKVLLTSCMNLNCTSLSTVRYCLMKEIVFKLITFLSTWTILVVLHPIPARVCAFLLSMLYNINDEWSLVSVSNNIFFKYYF